MTPNLNSKTLRTTVVGLAFALAGAMAWALPPSGHVCMIDPADTGSYLSCAGILGDRICCWIYGL